MENIIENNESNVEVVNRLSKGVKLFEVIKKKVVSMNKKELVERMEYNNIEAGLKSLDSFLCGGDLYAWIKDGNFDIKYDSASFVLKLVEILGIEKGPVEEFIEWVKKRQVKIYKLEDPYIFVETTGGPWSSPGFVRAFIEGWRRIGVNKEFVMGEDMDRVLDYVGIRVREHYILNHGTITAWGAIKRYIYHHIHGDKYVFDIHGNLVGETEGEIEPVAKICVGNKCFYLSNN